MDTAVEAAAPSNLRRPGLILSSIGSRAGLGAGEPQRRQREEGDAGQQAVVRLQRRLHVRQAEVVITIVILICLVEYE